ncbi:ABC transporter FUM19 [Lachnellula cervina]|uniref:ABC transporter FUM19 n=1 Tax=Lachnellula cervina TaxID=1316786 RepID=A0A7D8US77_9HELO|nr:ABC transporter FUM19 [Lachnellula cervina]
MLFSTACKSDRSFGPGVIGCRDDFDFTIRFELVFLSILPSCVFLPLSLWRAAWIAQRPIIVRAPVLQIIKMLAGTSYVILHLALLVFIGVGSFNLPSLAVVSGVLQVLSGICVIVLSVFENNRSPRPSVLLSGYLSLTVLFDATEARTFWLSSTTTLEERFTILFTTTVAVKVVLLFLESRPKDKWILWDKKEPHSPEETSGMFGLGAYLWLNKLFLKGYGKNLGINDLYPLDHSLKGKFLEDKFQKNLNFSKFQGDELGLIKLLCRTYAVPLLLPIFPRLFYLTFTVCQPFFIESLLGYLSQDKSLASANHGYGLIGASILIYAGMAISNGVYQYLHFRSLTIIRGCLATAIYSRGIDLQASSNEENLSVTLMSTDLERIRLGLRTLHDMWAGVIQVAIASWLLYNQLGLAFISPIVIVLLCCFATFYMARFMGSSQKAWMSRVEQRVGLTGAVIGNMKSLKIAGMADAMGSFLQSRRVDELEAGGRFRQFIILTGTLGYVPLFLAPAFTFAVARHSLDTVRIFTSLSWLNLITTPLSLLFQGIPTLLAAVACLQRIQTFLESDPRVDYRETLPYSMEGTQNTNLQATDCSNQPPPGNPAIAVRGGNFGWDPNKIVLHDIDFSILSSSFTIVVGPIACGKSTLCKALLGEVPFHQGAIKLGISSVKVSYCDQVPFLSNETIKDNILGVSPYDAGRYSEIIHATMLDDDLRQMPTGDRAVIGSNGINLSGGQKSRVALARALYLDASLLIFDDIFSGLDANTEDAVFSRVFGPTGLLRRRKVTFLLCTHSVRHLPAADHIVALDANGRIVEQGGFISLMQRNDGYVNSLGIKSSHHGMSSELLQNQAQLHGSANGLSGITADMATIERGLDDTSRRLGDRKLYRTYITSMGYSLAMIILTFGVLVGFAVNFATIWLTYWSDDLNATSPSHSFSFWIGIYFLLGFIAIGSLTGLGVCVLQLSVSKTGASLHRDILCTLLNAPLRYFTTTDQGEILNLFSQDMNLIDTELPLALMNVIYAVFQALGQAAVLMTSSPYLAISYPFLAALLWLVAKFYLRTSRQMRLLDLETKSPLYTHFLDTSKGIVTLRAFGFIPEDRAKNIELVDTSQRPSYLLQMNQNWLNLVLGLVVMVMSAVLTALVIFLRSDSGLTGASMVTLMGFGTELTFIVLALTQLETSLGAISRCRKFATTAQTENQDGEDIEPPQYWPSQGVITVDCVSASYSTKRLESDDPTDLALRNISLNISAGEKVAICGRTGSGKSTLVGLFLKLLDSTPETSANIHIDDIALSKIDRQVLRRRIIAIPQETLFLPEGTSFRTNLDPLGEACLADCQAALEMVQLWELVQDRGGLEAGMSTAVFSQGQRQLFSLACAVVRRRVRAGSQNLDRSHSEGGVLLMDEVSSSVDRETEVCMQEVIKSEFIMDGGEIVETGNPKVLSADSNTRFGKLCKVGGY